MFPSRRRLGLLILSNPHTQENMVVQGVGFTSQRFGVSISNIIRCEGVDWAMIVSQSKKNTDLKTMDVGGHGFDDD
ncbi:hypothetical protein Tco_0838142 [Tanacetum coccineum]|uniref:Uncharacterized protein n=1 Tax=Tanacetum coccineum TaxID=301880 RepID=A0ABQ5ALX7_9ASTR